VRQLQALVLAVLVEGALEVEDRIGAPDSGAGVAKDKEVHGILVFRFRL
jgi:hypothetical protein